VLFQLIGSKHCKAVADRIGFADRIGLLADRIGLWSAECGQVNQHQQVFAAQSPCAKTFKSNLGSGDSALGISPILPLRFIM